MSDTTTSPFGRRLRMIREQRGITQRWLCREIGRSSVFVCQLEGGSSVPSAETLMRLADVLGFTMDELYRGLGRCEGLTP